MSTKKSKKAVKPKKSNRVGNYVQKFRPPMAITAVKQDDVEIQGAVLAEVCDAIEEVEEQIDTLSELVGSPNRRITSLEATIALRTPHTWTTTNAPAMKWYWDEANQTWGKV